MPRTPRPAPEPGRPCRPPPGEIVGNDAGCERLGRRAADERSVGAVRARGSMGHVVAWVGEQRRDGTDARSPQSCRSGARSLDRLTSVAARLHAGCGAPVVRERRALGARSAVVSWCPPSDLRRTCSGRTWALALAPWTTLSGVDPVRFRRPPVRSALTAAAAFATPQRQRADRPGPQRTMEATGCVAAGVRCRGGRRAGGARRREVRAGSRRSC